MCHRGTRRTLGLRRRQFSPNCAMMYAQLVVELCGLGRKKEFGNLWRSATLLIRRQVAARLVSCGPEKNKLGIWKRRG